MCAGERGDRSENEDEEVDILSYFVRQQKMIAGGARREKRVEKG